ncbi:hypothetical protein LCGC14_0195530 [marine sediment metagenome]|uniref:HEAT repeat domain-containing protein n=1 Tax=marine sediment metagenome TaxID=412755 RepID=A0A0F9UKD4_9ZZZZ
MKKLLEQIYIEEHDQKRLKLVSDYISNIFDNKSTAKQPEYIDEIKTLLLYDSYAEIRKLCVVRMCPHPKHDHNHIRLLHMAIMADANFAVRKLAIDQLAKVTEMENIAFLTALVAYSDDDALARYAFDASKEVVDPKNINAFVNSIMSELTEENSERRQWLWDFVGDNYYRNKNRR